MIKKISFFLALFVSISLFSQKNNLDKYKYIIVADKFDFLKKVDQYQTSSLTKFLLKKKGFQVFLSNENYPKEIVNNRCLSLFASVKDESSMFTTKSVIQIKDCFGKILYASEIGKSKLKDYKKAYQGAIRNAFDSMEDLEYTFNPSSIIEQKDDEKVIIPLKVIPKVVVTPEIKKEIVKKDALVSSSIAVLYAQKINNGFQLVNTKPEVVFVILKTNTKDNFVIKDKNGNFYKSGTNWIAEYYEGNTLVKKEFEVKF